jgi:hypothetical protein
MNWVSYFERNRMERAEIPWELGINVSDELRGPLIRSLQRFQIGESGDGVHMRRGAAATGDSEYAAAIDLFLKEEGVHSVTLDRVLTTLGAPLLQSHWSHGCFVIARRFMGLHVELAVILIAEMIAMRYYQVLHAEIADPTLRIIFGQMVHDETKHLEFHCDTLRRRLERKPRVIQRILHGGLWGFYQMAFMAVVFDHRELLRALGVTPGAFLRECDRLFEQVRGRLFGRNEPITKTVLAAKGTKTMI